jgi:hypothetical protein
MTILQIIKDALIGNNLVVYMYSFAGYKRYFNHQLSGEWSENDSVLTGVIIEIESGNSGTLTYIAKTKLTSGDVVSVEIQPSDVFSYPNDSGSLSLNSIVRRQLEGRYLEMKDRKEWIEMAILSYKRNTWSFLNKDRNEVEIGEEEEFTIKH